VAEVTGISQELEKLARLHESGALTDEEFARAKDAALDRSEDRREALVGDRDSSLGTAANRYVTFQIVMSVIALIVFLFVFATVIQPRMNAFPGLP
jgi:Short C-terminal domain